MSELNSRDLPRWMREFDQYLSLKNLFLLHGNIYDLLSYPVAAERGYQWGYFRLTQLLRLLFQDRGYGPVAFYDTVDGLTLAAKEEAIFFGASTADSSCGTSSGAPRGARRGEGANDGSHGRGDVHPSSPQAGRLRDLSAALGAIRGPVSGSGDTPVAVVIDHASRLVTSPDRLSPDERRQFVQLLKCVREASEASVQGPGRVMNHSLVMVCDRLSDLPSWLYLEHPLVKPLKIDMPDERERRRYFEIAAPGFLAGESAAGEDDDDIATAVDLTRGFSNYELECLRLISLEEGIPLQEPRRLVETYKFGVTDSAWERLLEREGGQKLARAEGDPGPAGKGAGSGHTCGGGHHQAGRGWSLRNTSFRLGAEAARCAVFCRAHRRG